MRKFYSFLAFVGMMAVSVTANAQFSLPSENTVLENETYHMRLFKSVDFTALTINGQPMEAEAITFDTSITTDEIKFNGYAPYRCNVEGLANLWCATATPNWAAGKGLTTNGSGPRGLLLSEMKEGQIIVLQGKNGGYNTGETPAEYNGFCIPNGSRYSGNTGWVWELFEPRQVEDISADIHAAQDALAPAPVEGEEEVPTHDSYLYLRVLQDGWVSIPTERAASVYGFQVWLDASAKEAVSAPSLKLSRVNGNSRDIEFKPGESTFGAACTTYWGIVDAGESALFMKDTEEIDHYDYVYETDEEGNKVVVDSTAVYKQVLDEEAVAEAGQYGERIYEGVPETIDNNYDEDGDGFVTIAAATVSENGAYSDIVYLNISVGEIKLNQPTLTLKGLDGVNRTYEIGWTNNTICEESYKITVEGDNGELYQEFEPNTGIGEQVFAKQNIKVTVSVAGYGDGVAEQDVDVPGKEFKRKNAATDEEGNVKHDWDFVNISAYQQNVIKGEVIESCYLIVDGDSIVFSAEEFENGVSNDQAFDLSDATPNYKASCWWWDASRNRATLNVNSDTIVDKSLIHDLNANGYGYVVDEANIFPNININCPPNTSNNSCIFMYINGDLGAYFMAQPTLTFSPETVKAGEFVLIQIGQGGSNYTDWRSPSLYEVPAGELLSVTLAKNGVHVFYIDIYTYDGIADGEDLTEQWNETVAVEGMKTVQPIVGYYSANGAKIAAPQKGINMVKYADGTTMKILVK